jgi:hypothetical protein
MNKNPELASTLVENGEVGADVVVGEKKGTVSDVEDMRRMAKEQLFKAGSLITQAHLFGLG